MQGGKVESVQNTVTDILSFQVRPIALLKELVYIVLHGGTTSSLSLNPKFIKFFGRG